MQMAAPSCGRCSRNSRPILPSLSSSFDFFFFENARLEQEYVKRKREKIPPSILEYTFNYKIIYLSKAEREREKEEGIYLSDIHERMIEGSPSREEDSGQQNSSPSAVERPTLAFRSLALPTKMWQSSKALRATRTVILFA